MEEEFMLGDLDIQENAVIDLVITQEGGAATQMDPAIVELSKKIIMIRKFAVNV